MTGAGGGPIMVAGATGRHEGSAVGHLLARQPTVRALVLDPRRDRARALASQGIEHFVFSSVGGAERKSGNPHSETKAKIEKHIRKPGLPARPGGPGTARSSPSGSAFGEANHERFEAASPKHLTVLSGDGRHFLREDAGDRAAEAFKAFRGEAG